MSSAGHYLDHAATTPVRPAAVEAMAPLLDGVFGNPSGSHRFAREARRALDDARDAVAAVLGADPAEVVFTSGGTEADDLAVAGVTDAVGGRPACSATEHHAVLRPVQDRDGWVVPVEPSGRIDLAALDAVLSRAAVEGADDPRSAVSVVSVMAANNETGVVNDLAAVADVVAGRAPLHTDAVAAALWLDLARHAARADLVTISGHKVGGPKGIGALVVRAGTPLAARLTGGGQERERRGGTPNVAGAVGLAVALTEAAAERDALVARTEGMRRRLVGGLAAAVPDIRFTSPVGPDDPAARTAGTVHLCVPGVDREALLFLLDEAGVAASWGSSCSSGAADPSHVLTAMGVPADLAAGALRLSLGWCSTEADVDAAVRAVPEAVARLRSTVDAPMAPAEPTSARIGAS